MNDIARTNEYTTADADFYGIPVVVATRRGETKPSLVSAESVGKALGRSCVPVKFFLDRNAFLVDVGGGRFGGPILMVDIEDFFQFAGQHKSDLMAKFQSHVKKILTNVHTRGSHFETDDPEARMIPEGLEDDQISKMCEAILKQRVEAKRLNDRVDQVARVAEEAARKADTAIEQYTGKSGHYTVALWVAHHRRYRYTDNKTLGEIGKRLSRICHGRKIPLARVLNDVGNTYPEAILQEFIPNGTPLPAVDPHRPPTPPLRGFN
jgi:hypothetical protein